MKLGRLQRMISRNSKNNQPGKAGGLDEIPPKVWKTINLMTQFLNYTASCIKKTVGNGRKAVSYLSLRKATNKSQITTE